MFVGCLWQSCFYHHWMKIVEKCIFLAHTNRGILRLGSLGTSDYKLICNIGVPVLSICFSHQVPTDVVPTATKLQSFRPSRQQQKGPKTLANSNTNNAPVALRSCSHIATSPGSLRLQVSAQRESYEAPNNWHWYHHTVSVAQHAQNPCEPCISCVLP